MKIHVFIQIIQISHSIAIVIVSEVNIAMAIGSIEMELYVFLLARSS